MSDGGSDAAERLEELIRRVDDQTAGAEERRDACWALIRLRSKRAAPALIRALRGPDPEVAAAAADALGHTGSKRGLQPLIEAMRTAASEDVRYLAAYALWILGDERAVEPLFQ